MCFAWCVLVDDCMCALGTCAHVIRVEKEHLMYIDCSLAHAWAPIMMALLDEGNYSRQLDSGPSPGYKERELLCFENNHVLFTSYVALKHEAGWK